MQSTELLDDLQALSGDVSAEHQSLDSIMSELTSMDPTFHGAEAASNTSLALWPIFTGVNIDDRLQEAYELAYPKQAGDHSLYEHWLEVEADGQRAIGSFINNLKGKVAELDAKDFVEGHRFHNVEIAPAQNKAIWDISAISDNGDPMLFQVKTGSSIGYARNVVKDMEAAPDVHFLLGTELYNTIAARNPDWADRISDIGADYHRVEGIKDGLTTLSANMGLDIPDGAIDLLPYAGAIIAGTRLIYSIISTERQFKDADRTTRNKIQVVQTLTLMSRMGVSTVLAIAGGQAGAAAGGLRFPAPGTRPER